MISSLFAIDAIDGVRLKKRDLNVEKSAFIVFLFDETLLLFWYGK